MIIKMYVRVLLQAAQNVCDHYISNKYKLSINRVINERDDQDLQTDKVSLPWDTKQHGLLNLVSKDCYYLNQK